MLYLCTFSDKTLLHFAAKMIRHAYGSQATFVTGPAQRTQHPVFEEMVCDVHGRKCMPAFQLDALVLRKIFVERDTGKELQIRSRGFHELLGYRTLLLC